MIALTVYVNMPQFLLQFGLGSLWVVGVIPGQWAGVMLDKHTQAHPVRGTFIWFSQMFVTGSGECWRTQKSTFFQLHHMGFCGAEGPEGLGLLKPRK